MPPSDPSDTTPTDIPARDIPVNREQDRTNTTNTTDTTHTTDDTPAMGSDAVDTAPDEVFTDTVKDWIDSSAYIDPDAASEDASDYDGFLSYAAEWHAFTHGVFKGFTTAPWKTPPAPDNRDVRSEPHYYRGGYMLGTAAQVVILTLFGREAVASGAFEGVLRDLLVPATASVV